MKKGVCLLIALLMLCTMIISGCGDSSGNSNPTPKATEKPSATQSGIIVATQAPTNEPTAEPTPSVQYDDVVALSEHKYYSASSIENEGSASALGPEFCFDGDYESRWSTVFYDVEEAWICIQFGYPVIINGIEVYENQTWGQMLDWEAQYYSEEKQQWVTAYEETSTYAGEYYQFAQNTEPTYALRLNFFSGTGLTITISEIVIAGLMVEVPEGTAPREPMDLTPVEGLPENVQKLSGNWTYTASSSEMAGDEVALPPDFAFDGDDTTRWSTEFHDLEDGCWLAVDFKEQIEISGFVLNEATGWGHVTQYEVQILENGEWKTIHTGEEFSSTGYVAFSEKITSSSLRFLFTEGETMSGTVSVWEVELYN